MPPRSKWGASPYRWLAWQGPAEKGRLGREFTQAVLRYNGASILPPDTKGHDTLINGLRYIIRTSCEDKNGHWRFSQINNRDDFERVILFAVEVKRVRWFDLTRSDVLRLARPQGRWAALGNHSIQLSPEHLPATILTKTLG
jgi:hypothetical protein